MKYERQIHHMFSSKGGRDYGHSTEFFKVVVSDINQKFSSMLFSFHSRLPLGTFIIEVKDERDFLISKDLICYASFKITSDEDNRVYSIRTENKISSDYNSIDYDEDNSITMLTINESFASALITSGYEFFESLIALTKKYHKKNFNKDSRWVFAKLDVHRNLIEQPSSITIKLEQNLYGKITKSSIEVDNVNLGYIYFSKWS